MTIIAIVGVVYTDHMNLDTPSGITVEPLSSILELCRLQQNHVTLLYSEVG